MQSEIKINKKLVLKLTINLKAGRCYNFSKNIRNNKRIRTSIFDNKIIN